MTIEKVAYRKKQKPKYLQLYTYRFLPILVPILYAYSSTLNKGKHDTSLFIADCFFIGLGALILELATRSVSDSVKEIIIDNSEGAIEVKYFKGFFHRRERAESCMIKFIKYFYDNKVDEKGNPLEQKVSIEMPSGNYFLVREYRGFNKSDLEQIVKSIEYFNGRKFDS